MAAREMTDEEIRAKIATFQKRIGWGTGGAEAVSRWRAEIKALESKLTNSSTAEMEGKKESLEDDEQMEGYAKGSSMLEHAKPRAQSSLKQVFAMHWGTKAHIGVGIGDGVRWWIKNETKGAGRDAIDVTSNFGALFDLAATIQGVLMLGGAKAGEWGETHTTRDVASIFLHRGLEISGGRANPGRQEVYRTIIQADNMKNAIEKGRFTMMVPSTLGGKIDCPGWEAWPELLQIVENFKTMYNVKEDSVWKIDIHFHVLPTPTSARQVEFTVRISSEVPLQIRHRMKWGGKTRRKKHTKRKTKRKKLRKKRRTRKLALQSDKRRRRRTRRRK